MSDSSDNEFQQALGRAARIPEVATIPGDLSAGMVLCDRFAIERKLGQGGSGRVYGAFDRRKECSVALKTLGSYGPDALVQIRREFRAAAELVHPNLVRLHELFSEGPVSFFTMDLVRGAPLAALIEAGLGPDALPDVFRQLAAGLHELHAAGTLHGDIKPSNFLVSPDGHVVLLDFGLSRPLGIHSLALVRAGTPEYMAPEQTLGEPLTEAADWYAFGLVLHEALAQCELALGRPSLQDLSELSIELLQDDPAARPSGDEVLRRIGARSPALLSPRPSAPPPSLVGRAGELAGLRRAFQRAAARSPGLVFLHGPSGIGKTVLLERFLQEARGLGALVFAGKCRERESVGYKAADGIVDDLVAWLDAMPGPEARRLLPADLADLVRLFPALRAAAPVALAPKPAFDTPDRGLVKRRAIAAFRELIEQAARRHPVVLGIDDLQWGDAGTADLLGPILDLDRPLPVLFVGSFRTTGDGRGPTLDALLASETVRLPEPIELHVRPLKPPDAEYLAARLLGDAHPEGGRLSRTIAREANGNPLFISELACFAQTPEQRPAAAGRASLSALVRLRFEALPKPARDLLELTAIAGGPIARGIVRRSAGIGAAEADRAVDLLRASRLARTQGTSDDDELDVHHDRVRELLLRSLPPAQRAHHHLTLAKVLESRPGAKPEMIAAHYQAGGDLGRAGQFWLRAADSAFSTLAFEHAARLYDEGLALAPLSHQERTGVQIRRAEALEYAGRAVASANGYLEAAEHVARDESVELRRRAAEQLLLAGHLERGLAVIHEVLASLGMRRPRTGAAALASIAWGRARVRLRGLRHRTRAERDLSSEELSRIDVSFGIACSLGVIDFVRGADFQNEHLLLALAAGEPKRVLRALTLEVAYAATPGLGSDARTRHVLELAERLALKLNDPAGRALVMLGRGVAAHLRGHVAAALSECEEALQIFTTRCRGAVWESITAQRFIVWSQFHLGDLSALARQVPPLVQQADAQGNLYAATFFRTSYCNSAWLVRDQVDTAREQLRRARREWTAPGVQLAHCWMLMGEALLDFYCGSYDAAHERIEAVWPEIVAAQLLRIGIMRTQLWYFRAASALAAAHRADAAGLRDRSRALLELAAEGARRLDREPLPFARPLAALLRGGLLAAAGDLSSAVSVLRACSRDFEAQTFRFHAAGALVRAGQLLGGDEGDAWIARGAAAIAKEGVKNPLAMLRIVAPGFAEA